MIKHNKNKNRVLRSLQVDPRTYDDFKITCTIEGKYLGEVLSELMRYYIENHAKDWKKSK